jgi:homoserine dehydrogenase
VREQIRVGLLGFGNVGAALVALLEEHAGDIAARRGVELELARVAVRDLAKPRSTNLPAGTATDDAAAVVSDPDVDIVVELIGGVEPARSLILSAIEAGKSVVTGNKAVLAADGPELFDAAAKAEVDLLFEAAVAGGVPLMRPLRESLAGERIRRVMGIVNGTTNFILTRMTESGSTFDDALAEAKRLGYAESDPSADVGGHDAAAKAAILASIAFGARVVGDDVYVEGITSITPADIAFADRLGQVIKLLAVAEDVDGEVAVRVHPAMLPKAHPLASVRDAFNAVFVEGEAVGEVMFYGRGAGGAPTASAVLGDLIDAAVNRRRGTHATVAELRDARVRPMDELLSQYYLQVRLIDRPGVLADVARVFGDHGVSIRDVVQQPLSDEARDVFITHLAREADMQATVADLGALACVDTVGSLIRVIGSES